MRSLACVLLGVTAGCELFQPSPATAPPSWLELEASDFGSMHNVSKCGEVWFGGGITAEDVELAYRRGVESILGLGFPDEDPGFDLGRACADRSINLYDPKLLGPDDLTDQDADFALNLFRDPKRRPLLVVCGTGSNGATFFALWRALDHKMPLDEALEEARRAGMQLGPLETYVREQVERLSPKEE